MPRTTAGKVLEGRHGGEAGITIIELLVAIVLLAIAVGAITGMVIMSMRSQQKVSAEFRAQLNARQALYDMEKNIAEAKRRDSEGNEPIFHDDLISFPSQNGDEWITYIYTDSHPHSGGATIVKVVTDGMPTLPLAIEASDKQMINTDPGMSEVAAVEPVTEGAPIFSYFDAAGGQLATPVSNPREVRSVGVAFKTVVSTGHAQQEPTISTIRINLRNF